MPTDTSTRRAIFHERRISSVTFAVGVPIVNSTSRWLADSSDFGLLEEQTSPKWEIPCPGRRWTTVRNVTPLALSSAEKSVTVQTHKIKKKQAVNDISTPCLSACVDNSGIVKRRPLHCIVKLKSCCESLDFYSVKPVRYVTLSCGRLCMRVLAKTAVHGYSSAGQIKNKVVGGRNRGAEWRPIVNYIWTDNRSGGIPRPPPRPR